MNASFSRRRQLQVPPAAAAVRFLLLHALVGIATFSSAIAADADDAAGFAYFERYVRPVLVEHCYSCHSADADIVQGGMRLDSRAHLQNGGDSGPVLVPAQPNKSLLIEALRWESLEMPPGGRLPKSTIERIARWIEMGAPDPRISDPAAPVKSQAMSVEEGRSFWSFQPPQKQPVPSVRTASWPKTDIDYFILAQLEERNLAPNPDAAEYTLIRRLSFDLLGLPPTYEQLKSFAADPSSQAYENLVDRLLKSPQFGERWGRYWLDLARYADTGAQHRRFSFPAGYLPGHSDRYEPVGSGQADRACSKPIYVGIESTPAA
jgi:mono/diheme cytochrome c family protein